MSARVDGTAPERSRKFVHRIPVPYDRSVSERMHECEVCNARVNELRRGRCWGCYSRWVEARPVGLGARCVTCNEKRRRVLRAVELFGRWQPMCFNCAGQLLTMSPVPATIAELRQAVSRERRRVDRRIGKPDTRVFRYERRVGERRTTREDLMPIDDEMIIEVSAGDEGELDFEDLTSIRELVELSPAELRSA